jgi:hypothetical protein
MSRAPYANEGDLGGRDAQDVKNIRAYYPDFKTANNCFEIVNGLVLVFGGRIFLPFFYSLHIQN